MHGFWNQTYPEDDVSSYGILFILTTESISIGSKFFAAREDLWGHDDDDNRASPILQFLLVNHMIGVIITIDYS